MRLAIWLCKIGRHSWDYLGTYGMALDCRLKQCSRCGIGQLDVSYGQAWIRYTEAQVRQLLEMSKPEVK